MSTDHIETPKNWREDAGAVRDLAARLQAAGAKFPLNDIPGAAAILATEYFFAKAIRTYDAIQSLLHSGYGLIAQSLVRTMWELMISASWLSQDPSERGLIFIESEVLDRAKLMQELLRSADAGVVKVAAEKSDETKRLYNEILEKAKRIRGKRKSEKRMAGTWSGITFEQMAEKIEAKDQYLIYRFLSQQVHPGGGDVSNYLRWRDESAIEVGELLLTENDAARVTIGAALCLIKIADEKNTVSRNGFDEVIKTLFERLKSNWGTVISGSKSSKSK